MTAAAGENLHKSIGFTLLMPSSSVFCHASECPGRAALIPGSKVSYTFEADAKTGKARDVQIEEAAVEQEVGPREFGTIKVPLSMHLSRDNTLIAASFTVLEH